jgi:hypothetical protein
MKGDKYKGSWLQGEMHGKGIKSQKDRSIIKGIRELAILTRRFSSNLFVSKHFVYITVEYVL